MAKSKENTKKTEDKKAENTPPFIWPWSISKIDKLPKTLHELIGHKCRIIRQGDIVTEDFQTDRINIHIDNDSIITDISFG